ncbi:signal recognition particle subunit SRP19/SEC65 family protein [Archaeoglobus veneficus]|uniref:Signal recognition particle 19 kDa protein n=1 Tax=Archaeoglobus veneficus (strain DSM 11195 / SNP6) TaxID=693661 RepID=F2KMV9_ARCVS|nr:signal recognition particle subunit SRP19/SEC65 family protein [Archaeoglobus veneficus]AEA46133.1 Signal recognition particle 19 kDa protein [Archaeoglobus veneficus SNP6]
MNLRGERDRNWIIWTFNLDRRKSRKEGRKIAKKLAVSNVKLSELVEACKALNIPCRAEEKKYPKCWWEEGGRVVVPKSGSKPELMRKIAAKIAELREKKEQEKKSRKDKKKKK